MPAYGRDLSEHMRACSIRLDKMLDGFMQIPAACRKRKYVQLAHCVQTAVLQLQADIDRLGFRIEIGDLPAVRGNQLMLEMFFQNLSQNSLKYASGPAPVFHVLAVKREATVRVVISDNGPSIPAAQRAQAFQLFEQPSNRGQPGIGAGLALCKRIVENH